MNSVSNIRGVAFMLLSGAAFVLNDSLMKLSMASLPPYEVLVLRGLAGVAFGLCLLWSRGEFNLNRSVASRPVLLRAGLECGAILTYIIALAHAPIGDVTAVFQTTPLLVVLGLVVFHREEIGIVRASLIAMGFVGAMMVAQPGAGDVSPFIMLAFASAVFAALRDLAARQIAKTMPAMMSTLVLMIVVLCGALVAGLLFEHWRVPPLPVIAMCLVAGLLMMFGHHFTLMAYRSAAAQTVAPFYYSFMIFAVAAGYFIFNDWPNPMGFAGMGVIVISGVLLLGLERKGT